MTEERLATLEKEKEREVLVAKGYHARLMDILAVASKKSSSNKARKIRERLRREDCSAPGAFNAGFHNGWNAMRELILEAANKPAHIDHDSNEFYTTGCPACQKPQGMTHAYVTFTDGRTRG